MIPPFTCNLKLFVGSNWNWDRHKYLKKKLTLGFLQFEYKTYLDGLGSFVLLETINPIKSTTRKCIKDILRYFQTCHWQSKTGAVNFLFNFQLFNVWKYNNVCCIPPFNFFLVKAAISFFLSTFFLCDFDLVMPP